MSAAETLHVKSVGDVSRRPRICIIALSAIADDPRVRRQGDAFARAGWDVVAIGLSGAKSPPPAWPILTGDDLLRAAPPSTYAAPTMAAEAVPASLSEPSGRQHDIRSALRRWVVQQFRRMAGLVLADEARQQCVEQPRRHWLGRTQAMCVRFGLARLSGVRYRMRLLLVRFLPEVAEKIYWTRFQNILDLYRSAQHVEADVWVANDWNVLPIAARLTAEKGGVYVYDTHEFATEEYAEKWRWRIWHKPMVCAIERRFIRDAAAVSAVSAGIADKLDAIYHLRRTPLVIRNTPPYRCCEFRPSGNQIRVLYHGIVATGRGLEAAIESVVLWLPDFDLTIRGPENSGYSDRLRRLIREAGLGDRVHLAPAVPMTELVREAATFDIGFFALPGHSRHNEFALPNKFFEYLMAGLALCVSDLPEMARLAREYELGVLIPTVEPAAIAAAINGLDRERIDAYKRNALAAARELCWEREFKRLVSAYAAFAKQVVG